MMLQTTYTDMVDLILKFLKSVKGSPSDLIELLGFIQFQLIDLMKATPLPTEEEFEANENLNSRNTTPNVSAVKNLEQEKNSEKKEEKEDSKEGESSKLIRLMQSIKFKKKDQTSMLVEFHLKMLYSVHKNKKAPAYMLKSILISLDKLEFNRL